MKNKILFSASAIFLAFPVLVSAHAGDDSSANFGMGMMDFGANSSGFGMMRTLEDRAVGAEIHEEMESLMAKMFAGDLTETEQARMVSFMNQYPGPYNMMMNRAVMGNFSNFGGTSGNWSMMPWGGMTGFGGAGGAGFWFWVMSFTSLVWLVAGIFLIAWLWKQIKK